MLLYIRIPDYASDKRADSPIPESTNELVQDSFLRQHQAAASKMYQRTRENYLCERRFIL
jgi:hypothetical protein